MQCEKILITNVLQTGTAFGTILVGEHTGKGVFIPGLITRAAPVDIGDTVRATLTWNKKDTGATPYAASWIEKLNGGDSELMLAILDDLRENGCGSTHELAFTHNVKPEEMRLQLMQMARAGRIMRGDLWAVDMEDLESVARDDNGQE